MKYYNPKPGTRKKSADKRNYKKSLKSTEHYSRYQGDKRKKGELTFLALDSCAIFDMMNMLRGRTKGTSLYHKALRVYLDNCVFRADGTRNPNGRYVFCITPSVQKEMPHKNGNIDADLKQFLDSRVISLEVEFEYLGKFKKLTNSLIEQYAMKKIFVDDKGHPVADTRHVAEASFFNLTLVSGDKLIIKNFHEKDPDRKIEILKSVNRRILGGDFDGYQAIPRSPRSALGVVANGKRLSDQENLLITTTKTQQRFFTDLKYRPKKEQIKNFFI